MKDAPTNSGKTYSVHTANGCTVSDDSGWSKEIEAPDGYFTAHGSTVYLSDDEATMREVFKLAPQQRLALLGVLGGDQLPAGYTRVEYLESQGGQYINTDYTLWDDATVEIIASIAEQVGSAYIASAQAGYDRVWEFAPSFEFYQSRFGQTNVITMRCNSPNFSNGRKNYDVPVELKTFYRFRVEPSRMLVNGTVVAEFDKSVYPENLCMVLFAYNEAELNTIPPVMKVFRFADKTRISRYTIRRHGRERDFIAALDPTGTPCMYDLVSSKPFYNSASGAFIAGVENQVQLNNLLRKLPDRTGQDVGTLQVRLAEALQTPENEAKLDAMLAKNWEISQAA